MGLCLPREGRELPRSACIEALTGGFTRVECNLLLLRVACSADFADGVEGGVEVDSLLAVCSCCASIAGVEVVALDADVVEGAVVDAACRLSPETGEVAFAACCLTLDTGPARYCCANKRSWTAMTSFPLRIVSKADGMAADRVAPAQERGGTAAARNDKPWPLASDQYGLRT